MDDYEVALAAAGFDAVQVIDSEKDLNAYAKLADTPSCCQPSECCDSASAKTSVHQGLMKWLARFDINQYAASVRVLALKPKSS